MTTFYLGDCLEIMKDLSDNSIDCFICDLPYGQLTRSSIGAVAESKKCFSGNATGCDWDIPIDLQQFWTQVKRLARNEHTPVLMFCNTKFGYDLIKSNESWFRYDLVWDKGYGVSFLLANKMPMKSHEMIYVFSKTGAFYKRIDVKTDKGSYVKWGGGAGHVVQYNVEKTTCFDELGKEGMRCPLSVIPLSVKSRGGHPTEKPEELYE